MNLQEWNAAQPLDLQSEWDNSQSQGQPLHKVRDLDLDYIYGQSFAEKPPFDYTISEPVLNGFIKAAGTVSTTFLTMAGTFPAAGIKGYATYIKDVWDGKSIY